MQPSTPIQPAPVLPPSGPVAAPKKNPAIIVTVILVALLAIGAGAYLVWNTIQNNIPVSDAPDPAIVTITADGFTPETVKVSKGQAVTWTNTGAAPRRIAADDASLTLNSGDDLQQGESFTFTFDQTGTFPYHDAATSTSSSKGTVIVE
ncbi:MAG TPA: cupredoxin domain-containing protein [Candidatus Saccharimonadales bacterium]|nr:cupredoxin domain-containing protein [Candidatus Saccharimonadales bacterium]